jgi:acetoin utilization protein AcuB
MYVKDWMTKNVFTLETTSSIVNAVRLMRDRNIKHIPILKEGKVFALLSDRTLKEFLPSKGTSLDVYEMNYLLENTLISDIVKEGVVTAEPSLPIEEAALLMLEKHIGCLPVIENNKLVGIISDKDIFKAMVDITGGKNKGYRITVVLEDKSGSIKDVANIVREHGFGIESILSGQDDSKNKRRVVIRSRGTGNGEKMVADVKAQYPEAEISFRG